MVRKCRHFSNNKSDYDYYYFMDYVYDSNQSERRTVSISEKALDKIILELLQTAMKRLGTVETLLPRLESKGELPKDISKAVEGSSTFNSTMEC